ncbi:hypothetical protein AQJ91_46215 [Streptomyces dysideae]|uniref:Response regulatory domain-containing protein n=1 Tax=Streptomyces dysideae TaxID=909626 RepID=A0A101UPJ5_9ACTN|nr:hypothetical protein AQJ91_46215 [Streptomyces dysideae]
MISVAVVADDLLLPQRLGGGLARDSRLRMALTVPSVQALLAREEEPADVVLLDLLLSDGSDPVDNVRRLATGGRGVLVVSTLADSQEIEAVYGAGARGCLPKASDLATMAHAIGDVAADQPVQGREFVPAPRVGQGPHPLRLSRQERGLLLGYVSGLTLGAAARRIGIRPSTAKKYLERIKAKYQAGGRPTYTKLDLAARVREDGLPCLREMAG